jgi:hypothetical protein
MKTEAKKAQEFTIKGELIGTINLTDTFQKVKEILNNKTRYNHLYINSQNESISQYDLYKLKDTDFPILIITTETTEPEIGDYLDNLVEQVII